MTPLKTEANPNIQVGPLRWGRPSIATVCAQCLSQRPEYRRRICAFLKKALSDECIDNPELRELLFLDAKGNC